MTYLAPLPCAVADHLALAERQVGPELVSRAAWQRLRAIVDPLPPVAEEAGLEVRLGEGEARVDMSVCIMGKVRRRGLADAVSRSGVAARSPAWQRVLSFLRSWASEASPLHEIVPAVWLEFDADGGGPPEPFLIFSFDEERLYADGVATPEALLVPLLAGLESLAPELAPRVATALERCVRGLPRYVQLRHAAVRPTSEGDVVRLFVRMPWRRLGSVLGGLGWPGDAPTLHALLERICPETLVHPVNLDILADGLGPRVGVEFTHLGPTRVSPGWKALLDALESLRACAPARRAALEVWPGEMLGSPLGPGVLCVRRDLLVKVIFQTGAPLSAKAYLAFAPKLLVIEEGPRARAIPCGPAPSGRIRARTWPPSGAAP
jgi:hypothetical protein